MEPGSLKICSEKGKCSVFSAFKIIKSSGSVVDNMLDYQSRVCKIDSLLLRSQMRLKTKVLSLYDLVVGGMLSIRSLIAAFLIVFKRIVCKFLKSLIRAATKITQKLSARPSLFGAVMGIDGWVCIISVKYVLKKIC